MLKKLVPRRVVATADAAIDKVMQVEGQCTKAELLSLLELASQVSATECIVEIGSYRGRSTLALAYGSRFSKKARVFAVDPHVDYVGPKGGVYGPADQAELYRNIHETQMGDLISVVSLPSLNAAAAWTDRNIGLLWIDGDHRYEGCRGDFDAWASHLIPDAVVAFHDSSDEGVERTITELLDEGKLEKLGGIHSLSWFSFKL